MTRTRAGLTAAAVTALTVLAAPTAQASSGEVGGAGQTYYLSDTFSPRASTVFSYGGAGDDVYVGDWDGDGTDTLAYRRGATFSVRDSNTTGGPDRTFTYGRPGDMVLVGDWDGDGTDTFAVRRGAQYFVKNSLAGGSADHEVVYGRASDRVAVGDWDGDGEDTFAVRRGFTEYHVKNTIAPGRADAVVVYGRTGDTVLVGDWDGDGDDTLAVRRDTTYHLKNSVTGGPADREVVYGRLTDSTMVGDWDGDGTDSLGIRRPPAHPTWHSGRVRDIADVVPYSGRYDGRNGRLHPGELCLVPFMPSHYLHCRAVDDLVAFDAAYRARFGERLPVDTWDRSTYRTRAEQEQTWVEIGPPIAARPGTSPHGWGLAVDMFEGDAYDFGSARYEWMLRNGPRFGWENMPWHWASGSVPEYWHFDYVR